MDNLKIEKWNVDKFIKVSGNPVQRDTITRARRAVKIHLGEYHISHANVAVAKIGNRFVKLDGHTRSLLWKEGKLDKPKMLNVSIYPCSTKRELIDLYHTFDAPQAVETKGDQMYGALAFYNIVVPVPSFLKMSGLSQAVRLIHLLLEQPHPHSVVDAIKPLTDDISALLRMGYPVYGGDRKITRHKLGFPSAATTAFLVLYRLHGEKVYGFFDDFTACDTQNLKHGTSAGHAAAKFVLVARERKEMNGHRNSIRIALMMINAYSLHAKKKAVNNYKALVSKRQEKNPMMEMRELFKTIGYKI